MPTPLGNKRFLSRATIVLLVFSFLASAVAIWMTSLEQRGFLQYPTGEWRPVALTWSLCALVAASLFIAALRKLLRQNGPAEPVERISKSYPSLLVLALAFWLVSLGFETLSSKLSIAFERQWPKELSPNALSNSYSVTIDCEGCVTAVEDFIRKETLAEKALITFKTGEMVLWINPEKTTFEAVVSTMKANGYLVSEKP